MRGSGGRGDEALPLFEAAHQLNPSDPDIRQALGHALTYAGSVQRGVALMEQAQRLNPRRAEPDRLGIGYFFASRYEEAMAALSGEVKRLNAPTYWLYKAAAYAQLGQIEEARRAMSEALQLDATLTVQSEHERRLAMGLAAAYADHLTKSLRKAGLPERRAP